VISVIVPVRNAMPWFEEQLQAITEQACDQPWEVVIANNDSTDGSASVAQRWADRFQMIRLIDASKASGPGATRNVGAAVARGDMLAFCDADDVVRPGWLAAHVAALADADISAGFFDSWSLNGRPPPSPLAYDPPPAVGLYGFLPAAGSGNLAIRRKAFEEVGGFSEELMTGEDFDLCWRCQLAGYSLTLNADAVLSRRDQQGFKAIFRRYTAYGRCGPTLFQKYRADGFPRDLVLAAKTWVWIGLSTPRLVQPEFRDRWARVAGWRTGRLVASVRLRVLFP
jgi:glycosyltransferase involved in cell wall biosynthesis